MNRNRWTAVREIFEAVVDLPPGDRARVLGGRAGGDDVLHAEVEELLRQHDASHDFLEPPTGPGVAAAPGAAPIGSRIGGYRIERLIAAGGMGVVHEAWQESPRRRVALKMMRLDVSSPVARRRFDYESEVLARLQHPGIAQVFEAGVHREGHGESATEIPFFAMEFVEGARTIRAWAEEAGLDRRARLRLFLPVCAAVHHGHQRGVIHRDLKPSNILVGPDGQPKVIDFGIARVTDAAYTMVHTVEQIVGTLPYMSPEQLAGDSAAVDIRSDVYSLGLVLFELLCGRLPFELSGKTLPEVIRIVGEQPAVRASAIDPRIPAELDWILLRALAKDPEQRYGSAAELAADIRRHLDDLPVLAGPPSAAYRLGKLVRRHKGKFAAGIAALAALLVALIVSLTLYTVAQRERHVAATTSRYLERWLSSIDPDLHGRDVKVLDLLEEAVREIDASFENEPLVRAALRHTVGKSLLALGLDERARAQFEQALHTREALLGREDRRTLESACQLGVSLEGLFRLEEGERLHRRTLDIAARSLGPDDELTLFVEACLGSLLGKRARYAESERHLRHALERQRATLGDRHEATLSTLAWLADLLRIAGRFDEAEAAARESLSILVDARGPEHSTTLTARRILAAVLAESGRTDEADALHRETLAIAGRKYGPDHAVTLAAKRGLADLLRVRGNFAEAERLLREVLERTVARSGEQHTDTIVTLNNLGVVLNDSGKAKEAEAVYRRARTLAARVFGERDLRYAKTLANLALAVKQQGKLDEAEALYRESLERTKIVFGEDHPAALAVMHNLAALLAARGRPEAAVELYRKTLEVRRRVIGATHPRTLATLHNLVGALRSAGALVEAEERARESARLHQEIRGAEHPVTLMALYRLGLVLRQVGKIEEAVSVFADVLARSGKTHGTRHRETQEARYNYGRCLALLGKQAEAEEQLLAGFRLAEAAGDDTIGVWARALVHLYESSGRPDKAAPFRKMAARPRRQATRDARAGQRP